MTDEDSQTTPKVGVYNSNNTTNQVPTLVATVRKLPSGDLDLQLDTSGFDFSSAEAAQANVDLVKRMLVTLRTGIDLAAKASEGYLQQEDLT